MTRCITLSIFVIVFLIVTGVVEVSGLKTFSALNSIVFTNVPRPNDNDHSEYYFGKCATRHRMLLVHQHLKYEEIKGNVIVRGFLPNITRSPNCVYIKATSNFGDMVRYNAYKFNVCFVKIVHNFKQSIQVFRSFEWYIPVEMQPGIDWDLFFFAT